MGWISNYLLGDFMLTSFGMFCLCVLIQIVASLMSDETLKDEARPLVWEHWTEPLKVRCGSGLSDFRFMSAAVMATCVGLYVVFR